MISIANIFAIFSKIKPEHLGRLASAWGVIAKEDAELKDKVKACIEILDILTDYTASEADDEVVDAIKALSANDGVWLILGLVQDYLDGQHPKIAGDGLAIVGSKDEAKSIPWPVILHIVQLLLPLLIKDKK